MKIVLSHRLGEAGMEVLRESGAELWIADSADPNAYLSEIQSADALILRLGRCTAEILEACPKLKAVAVTGAGHDNVDSAKAAELGIPVVYVPGANARSVAEHAVTMMLALSKNLPEAEAELRKGRWGVRDAGKAVELYGKTVGIIGVGSIGRITAELCRVFGMRTLGWSHSGNRKKVEDAGCGYAETLAELLTCSDFVSLHIPLNPETRHLIGERELSLMKPTAFLVNTGRGALVDEQALADALNKGLIAGAGVDVYSTEPAEESNPLFQAQHVILTPHSAALTNEAKNRMAERCARGVLAVLSGERWPDVVKPAVYEKPWRAEKVH